MYLNDLLCGPSAKYVDIFWSLWEFPVSGQMEMLDTLEFAYLNAFFLVELNSNN